MDKKSKKAIGFLIFLLIIFTAFTVYFELSLKAKYSNYEFSTQKESSINEVIIDEINKSGKLLDYEYEISNDCGQDLSNYDLNKKGYYLLQAKIPDSPNYYIITSGLNTKTNIKKIIINDKDVEVIVASEDNDITIGTCIKITKNKVMPDITSFTVKEVKEDLYDNLEVSQSQSYNIGDSNTFANTVIKYKISNECSNIFKINEGSKSNGYYSKIANDLNYYYIMVSMPNGCYSSKISNITYEKNLINIFIDESSKTKINGKNLPTSNCTMALKNDRYCIEVYNGKDTKISVKYNVDDGQYQELNEIKES